MYSPVFACILMYLHAFAWARLCIDAIGGEHACVLRTCAKAHACIRTDLRTRIRECMHVQADSHRSTCARTNIINRRSTRARMQANTRTCDHTDACTCDQMYTRRRHTLDATHMRRTATHASAARRARAGRPILAHRLKRVRARARAGVYTSGISSAGIMHPAVRAM
jgi:hypothetical protein